jgi:hypothetical protein
MDGMGGIPKVIGRINVIPIEVVKPGLAPKTIPSATPSALSRIVSMCAIEENPVLNISTIQ